MKTPTSLLFSLFLSIILLTAEALCAPRAVGNPVYPFLGGPATTPPAEPSPSPPPPPAPSQPPAPLSPALTAILKQLCNHTDNPVLCFSSVVPFIVPGPDKAVDVSNLLEMQIKACAAKTQEAREAATKIAANPAAGKLLVAVLQTCTDSYDDAIDNLGSASKALAARDLGTLNSMLSAAMTDYSTCEDGFAETPGLISPMAGFDDVLARLSSNCLALSELLK
ncbi:pectinesterase inhibitor-like [Wolffia australiana]